MATCNPLASVTPDELKEIIDTDLTDARLCNFVNMAYFMTLPLVGNLGSCGGDDALEQIQLLLAAHFLTIYERTLESQSVGGEWSAKFAIKVGEGLKSSLYGQNAIALDCSGTLAKLNMKRATFQVTSYYQLADSDYLLDPDLVT